MFHLWKSAMAKLPLIVILGSTGSGKTKLSIDLARKFGGDIIGADSMQIYKHLDIISAKPTIEERSQAVHHLVDFLEPTEIYTVVDYRNQALQIIENLWSRNVLPIVVGGTNYYIESLLWNILVEKPGIDRISRPDDTKYHLMNDKDLYERLCEVDPDCAKRLHPNNRRKIIRALEVYDHKGVTLSEVLKGQQSMQGGNDFGGGLRFDNTIIFWLKWEQNVLDERINRRVDAMLEEGLLDELLNFHRLYNENRADPDYTKGIFQAIGFKEFHDYLMLSNEDRLSADGQKLFNESVENLKLVTRRYSKKQVKWIRNRLLAESNRNVPPVYELTTDDLAKWDEDITSKAIEIVESALNGVESRFKPLPRLSVRTNPNSKDDTYFCDTCERRFVGMFQYNIHLNSVKHKKRLQGKKMNNKRLLS